MKYGVLAACLICIPYTTAYAMLRDDTHATTPIIPDIIPQNITNKESNINLFLNVSVNSENTSDLSDSANFESHWPDNGTARPRSATIVITKNDGGIVGS